MQVPITMATLVKVTLTKTTSRTATLLTATRRTHIASTTAKECTRHRVQSRSIHWQEVWSESRSRPNYTHIRTGAKDGPSAPHKVQIYQA